MNRNTLHTPGPELQGSHAKGGAWARLIGNDVAGIDGDIEKGIALYQAKHGYTRDEANAELVQRLSFLGYGRDAPLQEDSCC